tara:strand:- start:184 stop:501 length:318 start_codon:yes stop_codon:yes gene_type:complete
MPSAAYLAFKWAQEAKRINTPMSKDEIEDRKMRPIFYANFSKDGARCKNEKCRQYKRRIEFYDSSGRVKRPHNGSGGRPIFDYVECYLTRCHFCKEEVIYGTSPS